jgi:hypothetical protein
MKNNFFSKLSSIFEGKSKQTSSEEGDEFLYNHRLKRASIFPLRDERK